MSSYAAIKQSMNRFKMKFPFEILKMALIKAYSVVFSRDLGQLKTSNGWYDYGFWLAWNFHTLGQGLGHVGVAIGPPVRRRGPYKLCTVNNADQSGRIGYCVQFFRLIR